LIERLSGQLRGFIGPPLFEYEPHCLGRALRRFVGIDAELEPLDFAADKLGILDGACFVERASASAISLRLAGPSRRRAAIVLGIRAQFQSGKPGTSAIVVAAISTVAPGAETTQASPAVRIRSLEE